MPKKRKAARRSPARATVVPHGKVSGLMVTAKKPKSSARTKSALAHRSHRTAQDDSLPGCRRFLICPLRGHPAFGGPLGMTTDSAALGTPWERAVHLAKDRSSRDEEPVDRARCVLVSGPENGRRKGGVVG